MSVGMNLALLVKKLRQKHCDRCGLYDDGSLDKCVHCSELNESQLLAFKIQHQNRLQGNFTFGTYLLLIAVILALILLLSFL
jgi:hypothetical protein